MIKLPKLSSKELDELVEQLKHSVMRGISWKTLIRTEEVMNGFILKTKEHYSIKSVIEAILDSLVHYSVSDYSVITINPAASLRGTNVLLIDLFRFITYGNLMVKGNDCLIKEFQRLGGDIDGSYIR